jgi:hypothetical protein
MFALTESENRMPVDAWLAPSQILRLDDRFIERDIHRTSATKMSSGLRPACSRARSTSIRSICAR